MTQVQTEVDQDWVSAVTEESSNESFDQLPAGSYLVVVSAATVRESDRGYAPQLVLEYTITEGQFAKRKQWEHFDLVANEEKQKWLRWRLESLNALDAKAAVKNSTSQANLLETLPPLLEGVTGVEAVVSLKHNVGKNGKTYVNVSGLTTKTKAIDEHKAVGASLQDGSPDDVAF